MKDAQNIKQLFIQKLQDDSVILRQELEQMQHNIDVLNAKYKQKNQQLVRIDTIIEESSKMEDGE